MYDGRLKEAQEELNRAKEINPTGSDLLYEIEGILKFWLGDYEASNTLLSKVRMPGPAASVFIAATEFYSGEKDVSQRRIANIEQDFGVTVRKLFAGENYRLESMKAKIAPMFPIRQVA